MGRPQLKELTRNPDVLHLQRLLLANGYADGGLSITGLFDSTTARNVVLFQLQHIDQQGAPLATDGVVGKKTWWALEHPSGDAQRNHFIIQTAEGLSEGRRRILDLLIEEHAKPVFESPDGSNRSEDIDQYWGDTGVVGYPWCCAFVSWTLHEVLGTYPIGGRHHLGVQTMWREARRLGFEVPDPKPGDLFIQIKSGGKGHTGFVVGVSYDDDWIYTCEGNCGNRLKLGRRRPEDIDHFIDFLHDGQSLNFDRFDPDRDGEDPADTSGDSDR